MALKRRDVFFAIIRGLLTAVVVTLFCLALVVAAALGPGLSDGAVHIVNQIIKLLAVAAGTAAAVGRGGRRGFVTGMVVASLYMILGYAVYLALGGGFDTAEMLGEILLGAAEGGIAGAVLSNLPRRRRRRHAGMGVQRS